MKKFFTVIVIVIITAALLELGSWTVLKFFAEQPDPVRSETHIFDAHGNHRLNPEFQFSDAPKSRIHSPDQFRQSEPVRIVAPDNIIRIFMLGTSALYGAGAGAGYSPHPALFNDETISHFLQKDLQQRLENEGSPYSVEVINAGVSATKTFHHLIRLNDTILEYDPDIIINVDGNNDFYTDKIYDRWRNYSYSTNILVDEFVGRTGYLAVLTTVRSLAPYSSFFNLMEKALKRIWYTTKVHGDNLLPHTKIYDFGAVNGHAADVREAARRSYLRDLWQIHNLGKYAGYDHCVFLQPEVVFEDDAVLSPADRKIKDFTTDKLGEKHVKFMQDVRTQLPALFEEARIPFHDCGQIASPEETGFQLYLDYCHLTPKGSEVLAGKIARTVYPMVLKRIADKGGE